VPIVTFSHVAGAHKPVYVLIEYESPPDQPAKGATFLLCDSLAKGLYSLDSSSNGSDGRLPQSRIPSRSRALSQQGLQWAAGLARLLQSRLGRGRRVAGLRAVCVLQSEEGRGEKRLWLHHLEHLSLSSSSSSSSASSSLSCEGGSVASAAPSGLSGSSLTRSRCQGDFCSFDPQDPRYSCSSDADLDPFAGVSSEMADASGAAEGGDLDDLDGLLAGIEEQPLRTPLQLSTMKSVFLARDDLLQAEGLEKMLGPGEAALASEAGREVFRSLCGLCSPRLLRWWLAVGRQLHSSKLGDHSSARNVPQSSAYKIGLGLGLGLGSAREGGGLSAGVAGSTEASSIPFDLPDRGGGKDRLGELSRFYSQCLVCSRCHAVYRDLDARRAARVARLKQAGQGESPEQQKERWRELEQRIFEQKQLAFRLSTIYSQKTHKPAATIQKAAGGERVAAKALLPPLSTPWNLTSQTTREAYEKQIGHSLLVRRVLDKQADHKDFLYQEDGDDDGDEVGQQWAELMHNSHRNSNLAGYAAVKKPRRGKPGKRVVVGGSQAYSAARLLHPWQRDLSSLRRQLQQGRLEENGEEEEAGEDSGDKAARPGLVLRQSQSADSALPAAKAAATQVQRLPSLQSAPSSKQRRSSSESTTNAARFVLTSHGLPPATISPPAAAAPQLGPVMRLLGRELAARTQQETSHSQAPQPKQAPANRDTQSKGTYRSFGSIPIAEEEDEENEEEDEDANEEAIGWSPFALQNLVG